MLRSLQRNNGSLSMKRGELWWAALPAPSGSGPGYRRPIVVLQANSFNESRIATVIAAAVTSNLAHAEAPGNVRLGRSESGLAKPSVVNVSQIVTIDRALLKERIRALPADAMQAVDEGLRLVLAL
jgi:mRNA interferase MazF